MALPPTPRAATTLKAVLGQLQSCRERGYAVCDGALQLGVCPLAAPLVDRGGATLAALSIAVRADRMSRAKFERHVLPALRHAQARLRPRLVEV